MPAWPWQAASGLLSSKEETDFGAVIQTILFLFVVVLYKMKIFAYFLIIKKINWSRSRDARIIFVSTSNFELSGTIIRVLDPRFQNGTHFWKAEGQLYKMDTKPENRLRHDPKKKKKN